MKTDYSSFIIMLARQRSGTNALQSVLEEHPAIFCTREVFHDTPSQYEHLDEEKNYFRFLERYPKATLITAQISDRKQEEFFLEYLQFLREGTDKSYIVIDIKYNSSHHFDGPWRTLGGEPQLFQFIKRHGLRVLHLTRRNYLRYFLSRQRAISTGQWVVTRGAELPGKDGGVELPVETLINVFKTCRFEDELVARSFSPDGKYLTFDYQELFSKPGTSVSKECLSRLATWLGLDNEFPQKEPIYRKLSLLPLSEAITNLDEVAAALRGTGFEYCLDDEAAYRGGGLQ